MKNCNYKKLQISVFIVSFVIILVCSLYLTSIVSYAETVYYSGTLKDVFPITGDFMTTSDSPGCFLTEGSSLYNDYHDNFSPSSVNVSASYNLINYGHYIIRSDGGTNVGIGDQRCYLYSVPDDTFIVTTDSEWTIYVPISSNVTNLQAFLWTNAYPNNTNGNQDFINRSMNTSTAYVDGTFYRLVTPFEMGRYQNTCILESDVAIYYNTSLDVTSLDDLTNVNPNYSGGSSSGILDGVFIYDNNDILLNCSSLKNGTFDFYIDTSKKLQENKDNYYISTSYSLLLNIQFVNGNDYADICIDRYNLSKNQNGKYQLDSTFSASKSVNLDGNIYQMSLSDLNDLLYNSSNQSVIPAVNFITQENTSNGVQSGTNTFINGIFGGSWGGWRIPIIQVGSQVASIDSIVYTASLDIIEKGSGKSILDFPLSKSFNVLTGTSSDLQNPGTSKTDVDDVVNNNNEGLQPGDDGYVDPSDYNSSIAENNSSSSIGGSSIGDIQGSSSSSTIGEGAIVINNNPSITNNNNSSSTASSSSNGFGSFLSTLITLLASGKTSSVSTIEEISGVNGYTELASSTFQYIPASVWTLLITTFTACIGISIIAFVIALLFKIFF